MTLMSLMSLYTSASKAVQSCLPRRIEVQINIMAVNPAVKTRLKSNCSKEFSDLLENIYEPCALKIPSGGPPDWLDKSMFKQGLTFVWQHYFAIEFCSLLNLVIGMSIPSLW